MDFLEGLTEGKWDMAGTWFKHLPARPAATYLREEKTGREAITERVRGICFHQGLLRSRKRYQMALTIRNAWIYCDRWADR